jgi:hypothetical protein
MCHHQKPRRFFGFHLEALVPHLSPTFSPKSTNPPDCHDGQRQCRATNHKPLILGHLPAIIFDPHKKLGLSPRKKVIEKHSKFHGRILFFVRLCGPPHGHLPKNDPRKRDIEGVK